MFGFFSHIVDIIAAAALTVDVLQGILDGITGVDRKIAIGIKNHSGYSWGAINIYFQQGVTDRVIPRRVNDGNYECHEFSMKALIGDTVIMSPLGDGVAIST